MRLVSMMANNIARNGTTTRPNSTAATPSSRRARRRSVGIWKCLARLAKRVLQWCSMTEKLRIVRATRSRLTIGHNKDMFANRCRENRKAARDIEVLLTLRQAALASRSPCSFPEMRRAPVRSGARLRVRRACDGGAENPLSLFDETGASLHDREWGVARASVEVPVKRALTT